MRSLKLGLAAAGLGQGLALGFEFSRDTLVVRRDRWDSVFIRNPTNREVLVDSFRIRIHAGPRKQELQWRVPGMSPYQRGFSHFYPLQPDGNDQVPLPAALAGVPKVRISPRDSTCLQDLVYATCYGCLSSSPSVDHRLTIIFYASNGRRDSITYLGEEVATALRPRPNLRVAAIPPRVRDLNGRQQSRTGASAKFRYARR